MAKRFRKEKVPTVKEHINNIKRYIVSKGFYYEDNVLENFYLCLKSKPFVIITGTSGTGKTQLAKLFAEALGATAENGQYRLIPVQPGWSDPSDLWGRTDCKGNFIAGPILDFVEQAALHPGKPFFLCLDEMNLARVEYYLSGLLSVLETRVITQDGLIRSDPLLSSACYGSDTAAAERYGALCFPENLYLVGTVSMDEISFPLTKRVLDRINILELSPMDLAPRWESTNEKPASLSLHNDFLKSEYLFLAQCQKEAKFIDPICQELEQINRILRRANLQIGYRVRDEIVFYLLHNKQESLLPSDSAMDFEILQRILPRIQGSNFSVYQLLCELFRFCAGEAQDDSAAGKESSIQMWKAAKQADCKYHHSTRKIALMVRRYEEDGFTSYWV